MALLTFIVLGAILVTYGWYWGGVSEARTSAYAMGAGTLILTLLAAFNPADPAVWALTALGAMYGGLATANAWNEGAQDRTYGLFALFFAFALLLGVAAESNATDSLSEIGLGALLLAIVFVMHFIAAALVPTVKGFKAFVGWITLIVGVVVAFFGYADALDIDISM